MYFHCVVKLVITLAILLFLFFKLKTAYEMRISDWSSDVCSSDLQFPGMGEEFDPVRADIDDRVGEEGVVGRDDDVRDPRQHQAAAETGTMEIGRASCRERVCQYV